MSDDMQSGVCPKCGAHEVYVGRRLRATYNVGAVPIKEPGWGLGKFAPVDRYVCGACGYVETYISSDADLAEIAATWPKVEP